MVFFFLEKRLFVTKKPTIEVQQKLVAWLIQFFFLSERIEYDLSSTQDNPIKKILEIEKKVAVNGGIREIVVALNECQVTFSLFVRWPSNA